MTDLDQFADATTILVYSTTNGDLNSSVGKTNTDGETIGARVKAHKQLASAVSDPLVDGTHADRYAAAHLRHSATIDEPIPGAPNVGDNSTANTGSRSRVGEQIAKRRNKRRSATAHDMSLSPLGDIIAEITELWRRRTGWHRAEKSLTLQALATARRFNAGDKVAAAKDVKAIEKGGTPPCFPAVVPFLEARVHLRTPRLATEKHLVRLVKQVAQHKPDFYRQAIAHRGFADLSLAGLLGEAGDLNRWKGERYNLVKRMGCAAMPDGTRQRRVSGDAAIEHGYVAERRSFVWNIGGCMIKAGDPWFRAKYEQFKAAALAKPDTFKTPGHAHNHAMRKAEAKFLLRLRALWIHGQAEAPAIEQK